MGGGDRRALFEELSAAVERVKKANVNAEEIVAGYRVIYRLRNATTVTGNRVGDFELIDPVDREKIRSISRLKTKLGILEAAKVKKAKAKLKLEDKAAASDKTEAEETTKPAQEALAKDKTDATYMADARPAAVNAAPGKEEEVRQSLNPPAPAATTNTSGGCSSSEVGGGDRRALFEELSAAVERVKKANVNAEEIVAGYRVIYRLRNATTVTGNRVGDFELIDPVDREKIRSISRLKTKLGILEAATVKKAKATDKDKTAAKETAAAAAAAAAKPAAPEEAAETKQALVILEAVAVEEMRQVDEGKAAHEEAEVEDVVEELEEEMEAEVEVEKVEAVLLDAMEAEEAPKAEDAAEGEAKTATAQGEAAAAAAAGTDAGAAEKAIAAVAAKLAASAVAAAVKAADTKELFARKTTNASAHTGTGNASGVGGSSDAAGGDKRALFDELVAAVERVKKAKVNVEEIVVGYRLIYKLRSTAGSHGAGDFHLIDPVDMEKIRSLSRLKTKLGVG